MFHGNLADFEELVQSVRDRNSREYIGEAATNYRSRCFRSAITATWVAVTYDIISKIRELSQQDGAARLFIERVDRAISLRVSNPVESKKQLQGIEGELLQVAHGTFEFLTDHELRNMERLYDDRNLCAHPAFAGEDYLYQPSPELVRMHIVHAIVDLLQHPPVQGRSSLKSLKSDLLQPSFPMTQTTVSEFMEERYFKNIKSGLVNNVITVLLKAIVKHSETDLVGKEAAMTMCLVSVQRRYSALFMDRMRHELPRMCDSCTDDEMIRVMRLFRADRRCWGWVGKASQIRITELVRQYVFDPSTIDSVSSCLEIDELRPLFSERAKSFTETQLNVLYTINPHPAFIEDAISKYGDARSFRDAEDLFETMIRPFITTFRAENINAVLDAAIGNSQIHCARETRIQMADLFERTSDLLRDTAAKWQAFLGHVFDRYDTDRRIYAELERRMTAAGIWPVATAVEPLLALAGVDAETAIDGTPATAPERVAGVAGAKGQAAE